MIVWNWMACAFAWKLKAPYKLSSVLCRRFLCSLHVKLSWVGSSAVDRGLNSRCRWLLSAARFWRSRHTVAASTSPQRTSSSCLFGAGTLSNDCCICKSVVIVILLLSNLCAFEVTTLWRYTNMLIIIIIIAQNCSEDIFYSTLLCWF